MENKQDILYNEDDELLRPHLLEEFINTITPAINFGSIVRSRRFYEFESPLILNRTEEVTIYNTLKNPIKRISLELPEFRDHLYVYDADGLRLQFHGKLEDYFENDSQPDQNPLKKFPCSIVVDFPESKPFNPECYRTIFLKDRIELDYNKSLEIEISIPFDDAAHSYVYIKKLEDYKMDIGSVFKDRNTAETFRYEDLAEKNYVTEPIDSGSYYASASNLSVTNCNLEIYMKYYLHPNDEAWFLGGLILGAISILLNFIMFFDIQKFLTTITAITTIAITYLVVIKGWVFLDNIDKVITINHLFEKIGQKKFFGHPLYEIKRNKILEKIIDKIQGLPYSSAYLLLIAVLFSELIIAILLRFANNGINDIIYIVIKYYNIKFLI